MLQFLKKIKFVISLKLFRLLLGVFVLNYNIYKHN